MSPFDIYWFMLALWFSLMIIGFIAKNKTIISLVSIMGIIFGILLIPESSIISMAIIFINIYFLYESMFGEK